MSQTDYRGICNPPITFHINNQRLPHNNHFQQSHTPCIINSRTIEIILRIPHELRPHWILMNIIQLLLEKLKRRNHLSITPILPKMILADFLILLTSQFEKLQHPLSPTLLDILQKFCNNFLTRKLLEITENSLNLFKILCTYDEM